MKREAQGNVKDKTQTIKIRNFRELEVWKLGKEIVLDVYRVTKKFPKEEMYGLIVQMRRAAVSIPSNVAKGSTGSIIRNTGNYSMWHWALAPN